MGQTPENRSVSAAGRSASSQDTTPANLTIPEGSPEALRDFISKYDRDLQRMLLSPQDRLQEQDRALAKTLLLATEKALAIENIKEDVRTWVLNRRTTLFIILAYDDPMLYIKDLMEIVEEIRVIEGAKRLLTHAERQVLNINCTLATLPVGKGTTRQKFKINFDSLIEHIQQFVNENPSEDNLSFIQPFVDRIETMPAGQRGKILLSVAQALKDHFLQSSDVAQRAFGQRLAGIERLYSLTGKPMRLDGTLLNGQAFDGNMIRNKVTVVQFWDTTCIKCREEIPELIDMHAKYKNLGFEIIGICAETPLSATQKYIDGMTFADDKRITWPIIVDSLTKQKERTLVKEYGITALPVLIIINVDGKVASVNPSFSDVRPLVEKLLFGDPADDPAGQTKE